MTRQRNTMPMPEGNRLTMGEYEPHHPAGQEPLEKYDALEQFASSVRMECEDTLSESHRIKQLEADNAALRKLYQRAFNCAAGLTNYVEDRPELRSIERDMTKIEADYRAIDAALLAGKSG